MEHICLHAFWGATLRENQCNNFNTLYIPPLFPTAILMNLSCMLSALGLMSKQGLLPIPIVANSERRFSEIKKQLLFHVTTYIWNYNKLHDEEALFSWDSLRQGGLGIIMIKFYSDLIGKCSPIFFLAFFREDYFLLLVCSLPNGSWGESYFF